jgi:RNA polymerase sigma factor (sigma-70 family)
MGKLTALLKNEYGLMVRYVQSRIDVSADREAEDIVQDVLVSLFERANPSVPIENLAAYIYRSLRNKIVDVFRRKVDKISPFDIPSQDNPEEALIQQEEIDRLFEAMDELNGEEKALILAQEFEDRTFQEISDDWDIPIGTLLARKSRALKKLRKRLSVQKNT